MMADFSTVFFDDFNGGSIDRGNWRTLYSGEYGTGAFSWTPSQVSVHDGILDVAITRQGGGWVAGGLSTIPDGQTYGSYEFRARIEEGQGTAGVILLWPSNNTWSDEVDIVETHRGNRDGFAFTNHGTPWETQYIDTYVADWHTYRLDWTPGELTLYVDGQQVGRMTNDVPDQPMSFGIQGHVLADHEWWYGGGPDGSTPNQVNIEVDWVRVSAYTPGQGDGGGTPAPAPIVAPVVEAVVDTVVDPVVEVVDALLPDFVASPAQPIVADLDDPWGPFRVNGQVDWNAAAAHVTANWEATGQWFI
ncbi:glycoside hydrolase family 16 protein [Roseomonas stagni]|uniref:Glycoside hydrolase family 16 protein n=1 Tax=Falsiroseomonas algicola TaxID=2716930 RepID=A0A6M1LWB9_9PROT|nr:glycoside hydrolase family 16 protein [Falsiroseomonas algicola]NGM24262.1 glycoside hydrolase family 16 protein [Falsiroseomonas algicola]